MNGRQLLFMLCVGISFGNLHAMWRPTSGPAIRSITQQTGARRSWTPPCRYQRSGLFADATKLVVGLAIISTWHRAIEIKVDAEGNHRDNQQMAERLKSMEKQQDMLLEQNTKILKQLALLRAEEGK